MILIYLNFIVVLKMINPDYFLIVCQKQNQNQIIKNIYLNLFVIKYNH